MASATTEAASLLLSFGRFFGGVMRPAYSQRGRWHEQIQSSPLPEIEAELLRAAEEHPGQPLTLGADGIARPADKHTPGPWKIEKAGDSPEITSGRYRVCLLQESVRCSEAEALANARLIAAAPELLDALRQIITIPEVRSFLEAGAHAELIAANQAIAKATTAR